jgi:putative inorganic carbon (HCO3(-)) transporter
LILSRASVSPSLPAIAAGSLASLVIVAVAAGMRAPALVVVGLFAMGGGLWFSGNCRLALLWGLMLSAPLALSKKFVDRPHMGGSGAYMVEAVDIFIVGLALFLLRDLLTGARRGLRIGAVGGWWIAMILLGLTSVVIGPYRQAAMEEVFQMTKALALFVVLINELVRSRQILHAAVALGLGVFGEALVAAGELAHHGALGLQIFGEATSDTLAYAARATYMDGGDVFRVGGLIGHPNLLAGYLAILLPMLVATLFMPLATQWRIATAATLLAGLAALVLTLSRSGWIAFGAAFLLVIGLSWVHPAMRRRHRSLRIALVGTTATGLLAIAPLILRRATQSDPGALNFRYEWMDVAWAMVRAHPLLGIGLSGFTYNLPGATRYGDAGALTDHFGAVWPVVHNIYLIVWAEQGTPAFLCFLAIYATVLRTGWRNLRAIGDERLYYLSIGLVAGICASMIDGLGSFFLRNPPCGRVFWVVAAMIVAIRRWQALNVAPEYGA